MTNYSKIYWLTRLDSLHSTFNVICFISLTAIFILWLWNAMDSDFGEAPKNNTKKYIIIGLITLISGLGSLFIPTQKEAILIVAGGKTMDFIQADTSINAIPEKTTALISIFLDKQIKDLNTK